MSESILRSVIDKFGREHQVYKTIEELTELSLALQHSLDNKVTVEEVAGELADVEIMLQQIYLMKPELIPLTRRKRAEVLKRLERLVFVPEDSAMAILRTLVALKLEKEDHGKTQHYRETQPETWDRAMIFLRNQDGGLSV